MPYWLEAVRTEVPEDELQELKVLLRYALGGVVFEIRVRVCTWLVSVLRFALRYYFKNVCSSYPDVYKS